MALHERCNAAILSLLPLAALAACGGKGDDAPVDPGQGGAGDGSGPGIPLAVALSVDDVAMDEGDSGSAALVFSVRLSTAYQGYFTVAYKTEDGTAKADAESTDYQATEGVLAFEPGTTSLSIEVLVNGDDVIENHETFVLRLFDPSGPDVELFRPVAAGRIRNDDNHGLTVDDAVCREGDFGETILSFPVRLFPVSDQVSTVYFATQDSSAANGTTSGDYLWRRGLLVFEPGQTELSVEIRVFGDLEPELSEEVGLVLFTPDGPHVAILDGEAVGTILDDDAGAQLDAGASSVDATEPDLASSGDLIGAAWCEAGPQGIEIRADRSADRGLTWLDQDLRVDRAPAGVDAAEPRIAVDGQNVYVVWRDGRDGAADVRLNRSHDGGLTWEDLDVRLDTDAAGGAASIHPRIAAAGGKVYVLWEDHRTGVGEVRFNCSHDAGATWLANDLRLNDGPPSASCAAPEMDADGDRIYVVWSDRRNGDADVYFDSSLDGGSTWRSFDVRVDRDLPGAANSIAPQIACDGEYVYVAWEDARNGEGDVYFNSSLVGGEDWEPEDKRLDDDPPGVNASLRPRISCDGLNVAVAWEDHRTGSEAIFCSASASAGFSWWGNSRVSRNPIPSTSRSVDPVLAHHGESLIVMWQEDRKGEPNLYMNMSTNAGMNFLEETLRVDLGDPGIELSQSHRLIAVGEDFQFVWRKSRDSEDVLFRSISVH